MLRGNRCLLGLDGIRNNVDGDSAWVTSEKVRTAALHKEYNYSSINDDMPFVGRLWSACKESHVTLESNEYYTPDGIAMIGCDDKFYTLTDAATKFGLEVNSTVSTLPNVTTILDWAESATREEASSSSKFLSFDDTSSS